MLVWTANDECHSDEPSGVEGFPLRSWSIEIWLVDSQGREVPANCFEKAVYNLHPSFERPKQSTYSSVELYYGHELTGDSF